MQTPSAPWQHSRRSPTPFARAETCLEEITTTHRTWLRKHRKLEVDNPAHRIRLAGDLVEPLARNCPYLQTLNLYQEPELRWSDRPAPPPRLPRYRSEKGPPADSSTQRTGEAPPQWWARGRLHQPVSRGVLVLDVPGAGLLAFEVPRGVLKATSLTVGEELQIHYRREWRKDPVARVVNILVAVH